MNIIFKKAYAYAIVTVFSISCTSLAKAETNEEMQQPGQACMITVDDAGSIKRINSQYIRMVSIKKEEPNIVKISMASNVGNNDTIGFKLTFSNEIEAKKSLDNISDLITYCRENALDRRHLKIIKNNK